MAGEESPIATVSYVLSAYSLVVVCANAVPLFRKGSQWVRGLPLVSQLLEDVPYRTRLTLAASLGVNILYAGFNALSGLYYRSPWIWFPGGLLFAPFGDALPAGPLRPPPRLW